MFHVSSKIFHLFVFFFCPQNCLLVLHRFWIILADPHRYHIFYIDCFNGILLCYRDTILPPLARFCAHRFSLSHHGSCNKRAIAIFWKKKCYLFFCLVNWRRKKDGWLYLEEENLALRTLDGTNSSSLLKTNVLLALSLLRVPQVSRYQSLQLHIFLKISHVLYKVVCVNKRHNSVLVGFILNLCRRMTWDLNKSVDECWSWIKSPGNLDCRPSGHTDQMFSNDH